MVSQNNSTISTFSMVYDGEGLSDNAMSVRDLAHSLLAVDYLFRMASNPLNGNNVSVTLAIRHPKPGSFEAEILLSVFSIVPNIFGGDSITAARNLLYLLFGSQIPGLLPLLKRLQGRNPVVIDDSNDKVTIEAENLRINIPTEVFRLFRDGNTRKLVSDILNPLQGSEVDKISVREGSEELETFSKSDLSSFSQIPQIGKVNESVTRQLLEIVAPQFSDRSRQWRFKDVNKSNSYTMMDDEFRNSVMRGKVSFTAGDIFICEVKTTQNIPETGDIKTDLEILRVIGRADPNGAYIQLPLDRS